MFTDYEQMSNQEIILLYSIYSNNRKELIQKFKFFLQNIKKYQEKIKIAENNLAKADRKYIKLCESYFNENFYVLKDVEYNIEICEMKLMKITNKMKIYISKLPSKKDLIQRIKIASKKIRILEAIYNDRNLKIVL